MADRLHLSAHHRSILEGLLQEHLPDVEAWAYGSRVNDRNHDGGDLDLALRRPGLAEIPAQQPADRFASDNASHASRYQSTSGRPATTHPLLAKNAPIRSHATSIPSPPSAPSTKLVTEHPEATTAASCPARSPDDRIATKAPSSADKPSSLACQPPVPSPPPVPISSSNPPEVRRSPMMPPTGRRERLSERPEAACRLEAAVPKRPPRARRPPLRKTGRPGRPLQPRQGRVESTPFCPSQPLWTRQIPQGIRKSAPWPSDSNVVSIS